MGNDRPGGQRSTFPREIASIKLARKPRRGLVMPLPDDKTFTDDPAERTVVFDRSDIVTASVAQRKAHVLVRMDGSDVGQVTAMEGNELFVGRLAKSQIHIPFEGVSRTHARFVWEAGAFWVEDAGSANGTFVQGKRVERQKLADGDVIQFGPRVVFRYSITDAGEEKILRQLYESSVKDALTGAYNRDYFNERLKAEVAYAKRHASELSLIMTDVDHFKKVNDTYGHPAGDAALSTVVAAVSKALRAEDVVARYGGEEFVVLLRGIALGNAIVVAERLRVMVEATPVTHGGATLRCTVSAGCAALSCTLDQKPESLVAIADRRLYSAKRSGRNRVVAMD